MSEETTTPPQTFAGRMDDLLDLKDGKIASHAAIMLATEADNALTAAHATIKRLTEERDKLMQHERMANQLYTTLRSDQIPPENGTGLIDEVRHIMNGRELLRSLLNQALARVEETKDDAAIVDWLQANPQRRSRDFTAYGIAIEPATATVREAIRAAMTQA